MVTYNTVKYEEDIIAEDLDRFMKILEQKRQTAYMTLANSGDAATDYVYDTVMYYLNSIEKELKENKQ